MKKTLMNVALILAPAVDVILMIFALPSGLVLALYRRLGSRRLPLTTAGLKRIGVFPLRNHYYEPLFDDRQLTKPLNTPRYLPGIDFGIDNQLELLRQLNYAEEFQRFVEDEKSNPSAAAFRFEHKSFLSGDAEFLYQFIRHFKPQKIVEIGSGSSTKIARQALARNAETGKMKSRLICIEPYEMPWLEDIGDIELIRSRVEGCDIDWSTYLKAGDLLFIDSSHIIRPQGDVLHEYLEIIPQLASGVFVHIHDIFSPRDYLDTWIRRDVKFWNEQYLLEAVLGNSTRYQVIAALNLLKHDHYDELHRVCPFMDRAREPGSFYFRVR
jgi:hypothetical protein